MNNDICKRYLAYNSSVRVVVVDATNMINKARNTHLLSNVVTAALGRTIIATTIMSSMLGEEKERITVQIKGDGPVKSIVTCGDYNLNIKGYATVPDVELPLKETGKLDVAKAIGKGNLTVIKDNGVGNPYIGTCKLYTSEIAEDLAYYFAVSEQRPCAIALGVNIGKDGNVQKASGYFIEPLPDCKTEIIDVIESINSNIKSVTNLMLDITNIDDVAKTITGDNNIVSVYEKTPVYKCDCNNERIEKTIIALGRTEVEDILDKNDNIIEVTCDFCNKKYKYNKDEIQKLFEKK